MMVAKKLIAMFSVVALAATAGGQALVPFGAPGGSSGQSMEFGGFFDHANTMIPTENLLSYSMSLWLSPDSLSRDSFFLGQTYQGIHLGLRDEGKLHQAHWGSDHSGMTTVPTGPPSDADSWIHAFYTFDYDSSMAKIYYNGINDDGGGVMKNDPNRFGPENFLILGARNGGVDGFHGQMDDVAFWDHVVSDADIAAIANGTLPTEIPDAAQLYFDFEPENIDTSQFDPEIISSAAGDGIWDVPANHSFQAIHAGFIGDFPQPLGPGNWNARIINLDTTGLDGEVNSAAEARAILAFADGGPNTNNWTIASDVSDIRDRVDMSGNGGVTFAHNHPYPNGVHDASQTDFVVHASTIEPFSFPEGTYAIAFGSDDGGEIILTDADGNPVNFTGEWHHGSNQPGNGDIDPDDNILTWNSPRGNNTSCGEITVPAGGLDIHVDAIMYERGGGDSFEIGVSDGPCRGMVNGFFYTLAGQGEYGITTGTTSAGPICELDGDGDCDHADINMLYENGADTAAIDDWLASASDEGNPAKLDANDIYRLGDANLDGDVDSTDLGLLLNNFGRSTGDTAAAGTWNGGDLNNSGNVDSGDLGLLLNNFGAMSDASAAVPEPSSSILFGLGMLSLLARRRRL